MEKLVYLYGLTLENYIQKENVLDEYPILETLLINFISKHLVIVNSKDLIHQFILYLKPPL